MIPLPIFSLNAPVSYNDWYLLLMTVSFLLSISLMGPFIHQYAKGLSVMFRFSSPDADICFPLYPPAGYVVISILSCLNLGLALSVVKWDITEQGTQALLYVLRASGVFGAACAIKILLYQIVNSSLYRNQKTSLKPIRWSGLFVMAFSAASFFILIFAAIILFLDLPRFLMIIGAALALLLVETGLIFKLKTALFKNKCSFLGFILYLCALELGPIALMLVLLSETLS